MGSRTRVKIVQNVRQLTQYFHTTEHTQVCFNKYFVYLLTHSRYTQITIILYFITYSMQSALKRMLEDRNRPLRQSLPPTEFHHKGVPRSISTNPGIDRQIDRYLDTQIHRYIDTQIHRYIDKQIHRQIGQLDRQTYNYTVFPLKNVTVLVCTLLWTMYHSNCIHTYVLINLYLYMYMYLHVQQCMYMYMYSKIMYLPLPSPLPSLFSPLFSPLLSPLSFLLSPLSSPLSSLLFPILSHLYSTSVSVLKSWQKGHTKSKPYIYLKLYFLLIL